MTASAITIRPVRNEEEHEAAILRIEELMGAEYGSPEGDELDALTTLVVAYEEKHFPIAPPDPISYIEYRLDQQGLTRKDLEPMIGSRARVSEVMTGKRQLTLPMIRRLRDGLGIPADILIGDGGSTEKRTPRSKAGKGKAVRATRQKANKPQGVRTAAQSGD
jgi:HTH-type transcriptional regulator/antitoxin HigA